jgi:DNA-directed RNA polymerase III subunit RPC1
MPKEQYREADAIKTISHVSFSLDSAEQMQQSSHLHVKVKSLYNQDQKRTPLANGVLDLKLGVSQKGTICETCNQGLNECVGHFGYLDLALPVFHIGHFRATVTILQTTCKTCSRVMLKDEDAKVFSKKLMNPNLSYLAKKAIHQQVINDKISSLK